MRCGLFCARISFGPLGAYVDVEPLGVDTGVDAGVGSGVEWKSDADLAMELIIVVVVLERILVVLVPWTVVPLKLDSLVFVLCRAGVGTGVIAMPRAAASLASP